MQVLFKITLIFGFLSYGSSLNATQDGDGLINGLLDKSEILEVSSSGDSIILNRGSMEGIKVGFKGQFFFQQGKEFPAIDYVAEGECIKSYKRRSFWILSKVRNRDHLRKGHVLSLVGQVEELSGRAPWKILNKQSVHHKGMLSKNQKDNTGIPVYNEKGKGHEKQLIITKMPNEYREENVQYNFWEQDDEQKDFTPEYDDKLESLDIEEEGQVKGGNDLKELMREDAKNSTVAGAVKKANESQFGLTGLYHEQHREKDLPFMQAGESYRNVYKRAKEKREKRVYSPRALARLHRDRANWSKDMPDDQIRRYFDESGLLEEVYRQKYAFEHIPGNEVFFRIGVGMNSNALAEDSNNQGSGTDFSMGYEYQFAKTSDKMRSWTADISLASQRDYYSMSSTTDLNVKSKETIYRLYLNWYLYNYPTSLNKYMFHLGVGLGFGRSTANAPSLSKDYEYNITVPISYQFGLKYRFKLRGLENELARVGVGFNALLTYETKEFSTEEELVDNIDGNKSFNDIKLSVGVGLYF